MKSSALSKFDTTDIAREIEEVKATLATLVERMTDHDSDSTTSRIKSAVGSVSEIKRAAQERLQERMDQGQALAENARAVVADSADRTANAVKENPLLSLAIAAGIGLIVGSMTRSR